MTLESMNLDRRDFTNEEEYDPLNPTQQRRKDGVNIQLQEQRHFMDKSNTVMSFTKLFE